MWAKLGGQWLSHALLADSRRQSRVTHLHSDYQAGSAFVNAAIYHLLHGVAPKLDFR